MSRLDLLLVLPMMDADADCFWIAECAASAVGAISSGGGTVRCFLLFGCAWTSSSLLLPLEEVELASDSSVMMVCDFLWCFGFDGERGQTDQRHT